MTDLRASFRRPFDEQLAAFRLRLGSLAPTARWDDLWQAEHDRAFMVAGAVKAELLADLGLAVDRAIAEGTGFEAFQRDFRAVVEQHGWHGWTGEGSAKGEAWRMRVIYRTNMATSYAAGRYAQLIDGDFAFWVYKHGNALEPRLQHLAWDGVALRPDHPFWQTHAPPNGWGCTCRIRGARSEAGIRRAGGDPHKHLADGWQARDPKTGAPVGIDKGWDYAPGASVAATVSLGAKKIASLPPEIGSDYGTSMTGIIDRYWPMWVADTQSRGTHDVGLAGVLGRDLITKLGTLEIAPASAEIMVRPGLLIGPKAIRHETKGDNLSGAEWLTLPRRLRAPRAVLLDTNTGNLLYILDGSDGLAQLAVAIDYKRSRRRLVEVSNTVISAYRPVRAALLERLASGLLKLIVGELG